VTGAPGSGKSLWTFQQVGRSDRLFVWDSAAEWRRWAPDLVAVDRLGELADLVRADIHGKAPTRIAYTGLVSVDHFRTWCALAWVWIRAHERGVIVAEELSDVTSPGKAPAAWGEILRKHRHTRGSVYGLTQRPAESDKTIVGNATVIHCGRMNLESDELYMARLLRVPLERVQALGDLEYLERNMRTRELIAGRVRV
jgi:hypothetical protein